jgi:hypothetical protein
MVETFEAKLRFRSRRGMNMRTGNRLFSQRSLRCIGRWILAWFVLSIGAAVAAPCVQPLSMQLVCSGAGPVKVMVNVDGDVHEMGSDQMDCALCVPGGAPPPVLLSPVAPPALQPLGRIVQSIPSARLASIVSASLPPRGPPALV